jgi:hypothetical protein
MTSLYALLQTRMKAPVQDETGSEEGSVCK